MVLPFYGDCNSHKNGAAQADVEEGKDEVLESLNHISIISCEQCENKSESEKKMESENKSKNENEREG